MNKKLKYGSLSIAFTVIVLAAVIIFNVIMSTLASKFSLNIDLTTEELYSISTAAKEFISDVDSNIKIYFLKDRDRLDKDGEAVLMVRNLVEEFGKEFKNISVEYIDIEKNPAFAAKYATESATTISKNYIIVESEKTGQFRLLAPAAFFYTAESDGSLFAFKGEITLTNAIIQVSDTEPPVVAFTTGHGERVHEAMALALTEAGFEVQVIDLAKEEIDERTKILFISDPTNDFGGYAAEQAGGTNEIEKIADYLKNFHHLVVAVDPETKELPELSELLEEWGLGWEVGTTLTDLSHSLGTDALSLVSQYTGAEGTPAYQLHKAISTIPSAPKTIFRNAVPLKVNPDAYGCVVETGFKTYDTAMSYVDGKEAGKGEFPLLATSSNQQYIGEAGAQALVHSTVVLIGSTEFLSNEYVNVGAYGNKEVIYAMARLMGSQRVPNGLDYKMLTDQSLDIESEDAKMLTMLICGIGPLIVAIIGLGVFIKRRHL